MNLLLIHGLAGSGRYFKDLELNLRSIPNIHTCAPDLLGFGRNFKYSGPFTLAKQLEYLTEEVARVFGNEKVFIIGHSMGGILAANWALENKARIKGIILLNTPLGQTTEEIYRELGNGSIFGWSYFIIKHKNLTFLSCKLLCKFNGMRLFKILKPKYMPEAVFEDYRLHSWISLTQNFTNIIINYPLMPVVLKLTGIPILNIIASRDNPISKKLIEGKNIINKTLKGGHNLLLENPTSTFITIKEFILPIK